MPLKLFFSMLPLVGISLLLGCGGGSSSGTGDSGPPITWVHKDLEHGGAKISLGYRESPSKVPMVEPIATISRDGKPVAGAMVFVSLDAAPEVATVYEPQVGQTLAHYTPGKVSLPGGPQRPLVKFRIVLPDSKDDFTREISLSTIGE